MAWQGVGNGEVDVIIENWGHPDLVQNYITKQKTAQHAGPNGNIEVIGWYVPPGSLWIFAGPNVVRAYAPTR
jgi:glycine betaine/proline transport system substrate-binding protein